MTSVPGYARPAALVIVDDNTDHAWIVRHVVADVAPGFPVIAVHDPGLQLGGLELAPAGAVVLLDRVLLGVDGIALLPALHVARPDLRLVLWSAVLSEQDRARALAAGASAVLEKPLGLEGWRTLLVGLLDGAPVLAADAPPAG